MGDQIIQVGNVCPTKTRSNPNQGRVYDPQGISPKRFDIVFAKELEKNRSGYWYLLDYELIA